MAVEKSPDISNIRLNVDSDEVSKSEDYINVLGTLPSFAPHRWRYSEMAPKISSSLLLPSELKHYIAELCPPSTLASLAQIHTTYQIEAEQALYHTIFIVSHMNSSLKCMETLAANQEKASYIRVLSIQWTQFAASDYHGRIMTYLLKGLINMHALYDFRLQLSGEESLQTVMELNENLCGSHFRLKTLYCNFYSLQLDVALIINNQTELQILGLYNQIDDLPAILQQFNNLQLFLPMVLTVEPTYEHIGIFPVFYSEDRIAMIHQVLVESLDKEQGQCFDVNQVEALSIYLIDSSEMTIIHALLVAMAATFPHITYLAFFFEHQCEIFADEVTETISLFTELTDLVFNLWPGHYENERLKTLISEDIKEAQVREWADVCPELLSVTFMDDTALCKLGDEWELD